MCCDLAQVRQLGLPGADLSREIASFPAFGPSATSVQTKSAGARPSTDFRIRPGSIRADGVWRDGSTGQSRSPVNTGVPYPATVDVLSRPPAAKKGALAPSMPSHQFDPVAVPGIAPTTGPAVILPVVAYLGPASCDPVTDLRDDAPGRHGKQATADAAMRRTAPGRMPKRPLPPTERKRPAPRGPAVRSVVPQRVS